MKFTRNFHKRTRFILIHPYQFHNLDLCICHETTGHIHCLESTSFIIIAHIKLTTIVTFIAVGSHYVILFYLFCVAAVNRLLFLSLGFFSLFFRQIFLAIFLSSCRCSFSRFISTFSSSPARDSSEFTWLDRFVLFLVCCFPFTCENFNSFLLAGFVVIVFTYSSGILYSHYFSSVL